MDQRSDHEDGRRRAYEERLWAYEELKQYVSGQITPAGLESLKNTFRLGAHQRMSVDSSPTPGYQLLQELQSKGFNGIHLHVRDVALLNSYVVAKCMSHRDVARHIREYEDKYIRSSRYSTITILAGFKNLATILRSVESQHQCFVGFRSFLEQNMTDDQRRRLITLLEFGPEASRKSWDSNMMFTACLVGEHKAAHDDVNPLWNACRLDPDALTFVMESCRVYVALLQERCFVVEPLCVAKIFGKAARLCRTEDDWALLSRLRSRSNLGDCFLCMLGFVGPRLSQSLRETIADSVGFCGSAWDDMKSSTRMFRYLNERRIIFDNDVCELWKACEGKSNDLAKWLQIYVAALEEKGYHPKPLTYASPDDASAPDVVTVDMGDPVKVVELQVLYQPGTTVRAVIEYVGRYTGKTPTLACDGYAWIVWRSWFEDLRHYLQRHDRLPLAVNAVYFIRRGRLTDVLYVDQDYFGKVLAYRDMNSVGVRNWSPIARSIGLNPSEFGGTIARNSWREVKNHIATPQLRCKFFLALEEMGSADARRMGLPDTGGSASCRPAVSPPPSTIRSVEPCPDVHRDHEMVQKYNETKDILARCIDSSDTFNALRIVLLPPDQAPQASSAKDLFDLMEHGGRLSITNWSAVKDALRTFPQLIYLTPIVEAYEKGCPNQ